MTSTFLVTLDRTAPPLALEVISVTPENVVTIRLASDAEAFEFRLWGAIDAGDPLNSDYGTTEEGAEWQSFDEERLVRLPMDQFVRLHVQVRDDVWNASEVKTLEFGEAEEPTLAPTRRGTGPVEPRPRPVRRQKDRRLSRASRVTVTSSVEIGVEMAVEHEPVATELIFATSRQGTRSSLLRLSSESRVTVESERRSSFDLQTLYGISRRSDPREDEAIMALLL